ncbi:bifunctional riboflavin kinase/FAD synthetase [Saccharophagus degradans]|uniref:Riboflavin biosynthesis protein n=1 Tax=Saccharophagus degradans TaxID=86304 RepID=A0AAW7XE28_9GAMM|nr:bifunctional riboflavin kinase/FAD synthetase [Saccharophagus degradans]MDO6424677.1 bifunctional riboflavin kinase/FAD synthetase [Saccharophagus degradans]MDO6609010.1 bifunctional riboflavin kinase/FAD synthetase [Saccharophagus degradans]WGO99965.1 bifunctional riboflavin kinase/FAD synthetase [Saccharophagus degradans]
MTSHQFACGRFKQAQFLPPFDATHKACVVTIGSFDGVHLGHQQLLRQVVAQAAHLQLPSVVIVFEPQPHEFFSKENAPARLMRLREKVQALFAAGVDKVLCLRFNQQLRNLTANDFVEQVLVKGLGVKYLVVGDDFKFGCDRSGDFAALQQQGEKHGFSVVDTQTQLATTEHDGTDRISSTRIRALLETDKFDQAAALLGAPFSVAGRVVYGKQLGRTLGFPTANIGLGRYRSPVNGVYGVVLIANGQRYNAVANVGVRPTLGGRNKPILEVHALTPTGNLYGEFVRVEFKFKIRQEMKFTSLDALKNQIADDVSAAKRYFQSND